MLLSVAVSRKISKLQPLGVLSAPFVESGCAIDGHCSDASLYLIGTRNMQEILQFLLAVEPEYYSLADSFLPEL